MEAGDKNWASKYLLDPLNEPQPADETGPGTSFRPDSEVSTKPPSPPQTSTAPTRRLSKTNPYHNLQSHGSPKETIKTHSRELSGSRATPPPAPSAAASQRATPPHRQEAFSSNGTRPRRTSSLKERYPGDPSVRPLDQLAREKAIADRARHMTKKHAVRPDTIDSLDESGTGFKYHHEGPYDATLFARNNSSNVLTSPVAAVSTTNAEALKATPREKLIDSLDRHRPLDGVAAYAPGETDPAGHRYSYEQGDNMMIDENAGGGPYKRWAGMQYHPDDIKGKGEPSYSIEKALKEHSLDEKRRAATNDETTDGIEMSSNVNVNKKTHSRQSSLNNAGGSPSIALRSEAFGDDDDQLRRRGSLSNRLRKRVGSLKKKLGSDE